MADYGGRLDRGMIRENNQKRIVTLVRKNSDVSRASLATELGLSRPAVSSHVHLLIREAVLMEDGVLESNGGRNAIHLNINPGFCNIVGIVIQKRYMVISYYDFAHRPCGGQRVEFDSGTDSPRSIIQDAERRIMRKLAGTGRPVYVVLLFPGIVYQRRVMVSNSMPAFNDVDISGLFRIIPQERVSIINDIKAKVTGLHEKFIYKNYHNIVYLSQEENGIGAGFLINGQVYEGTSQRAGEVGLMYNIDKALPTADLRGGLTRFEDFLIPRGGVDEGGLTAPAYDEEQMERIAQYYSVLVNNLAYVIDPDVVVLGGVLSQLGEDFHRRILANLSRIATTPIRTVLSEHDDEATKLGILACADWLILDRICRDVALGG
jgi:predicted NBD/HSP70 family sugar kinase